MTSASCTHPQFAHVFDRARGIVTCTICGDVVSDTQLEVDPSFLAHNEGGRSTATTIGLRTAGFARPTMRSAQPLRGVPRPSVDVARKSIAAIARQLEISPDHAETAVGVYKTALSVNAVIGAKSAVLCACLYIVCRRNGTPHMILDFSDITKDPPFVIIGYMRTICRATYTALPPPDPSLYVARFALQLNFGEHAEEISVCALKVLRMMRDDWIHTGRRPLGPCAAALIVAARAFGYEVSIDDVAKLARLSASTIALRVDEFVSTPAATLTNVDEYQPSETTKPASFVRGRLHDARYDFDNDLRELTRLYYELIDEAKRGEPATSARCEKWQRFLLLNAQLQGPSTDGGVVNDRMKLQNLTCKEQLVILGVPQEHVRTPSRPKKLEASEITEGDLEQYRQLLAATGGVTFDALKNPDVLHELTREGEHTLSYSHIVDKFADVEVLSISSNEEVIEDYVIRDLEVRISKRKALDIACPVTTPSEPASAPCEPEVPSQPSQLFPICKKEAARKRKRISQPAGSVLESVSQALRGRGAGQIDLANLDALLPGASAPSEAAESAEDHNDNEWPVD